jgi:hypothetical protein
MTLRDVELVDESGNVIPVAEVKIDDVELPYEGMSGRPVLAPTRETVHARLWSTLRIRQRNGGAAVGAFIFTGLGTALGKVAKTVICGVQLADML